MEWYESLGLLLGAILALMAIGMPVALAFLAANIIGAWVFMGGERGISALLNNGLGSLTSFALVPIPLFLLMGEIFFHTGLGGRMFNAIDKLLGRGVCPMLLFWVARRFPRCRARPWDRPR